MLVFIYLFFILIEQYYSYIIIPLKNFEKFSFALENKYTDYILSYSYISATNSSTSTITIKAELSGDYSVYVYVYDNFTKLIEDGNHFQNYIKNSTISSDDTFHIFSELTINNYKNKTFYFSFEKKINYYKNSNITFTIYATDTLTIIPKVVTLKMHFTRVNKAYNYLFKIEKNHQQYILFGFRPNGYNLYGNLQIFEEKNNEPIYSIKKSGSIENYLELKNNCSYFINLTFISTYKYTTIKDFTFYFAQSNYYNKIIPAEINTEYFQEFPVLLQTKILLDLTTIEKGNKMLIEYDRLYSYDDAFTVYGYYTDDHNTIQNTSGQKLEIIRDKECLRVIKRCKDYLRKESPDLKYVIFQVTQINYDTSIFLRYGFQERYYPETIYLSCGIGLALSLPNIILHILNKIKYKHENFSKVFLIMDISLHLGLFNIISKFVYLGGDSSYYLGVGFLAFYFFILICYYNYYFFGRNINKIGFAVLFKRLSINKTIEQAINENKILKPDLKIKIKAFHKESREKCIKIRKNNINNNENDDYDKENIIINGEIISVTFSDWGSVENGGGKFPEKFENTDEFIYQIIKEEREIETWSKENEFKYNTWQDITNFNLNENDTILDVHFNYEIKFDDEAKEDLNNMKSEMEMEGKSHDIETGLTEIFTIPGFNEEEKCIPNNNYKKRLIEFILGLIINFSGYSSFVNFFVKNGGKRVEVTIKKLVTKSIINDGNMNFIDSINDDTSFKERESDVNGNIIEPLLV